MVGREERRSYDVAASEVVAGRVRRGPGAWGGTRPGARARVGLGYAPDVVGLGRRGIVMMLFMLLFWGMVIAGLVVGIRWLAIQRRAWGTDSAMQILRERYARGDISREEFEAKRRDLGP